MFELDTSGEEIADLSYIEHKATGARTAMVFNGLTWDLECEIIPYCDAKHLIADDSNRLSALSKVVAKRKPTSTASSSHGGPAPPRP